MGLDRSPPSPLQNDIKRGKTDALKPTCLMCTKTVEQNAAVSCHDCRLIFHTNCAFLSPNQESYFVSNSIPWTCPACYFAKSASTSSTISNLHSSMVELRNNLKTCLDNISVVASQLSAVHQELSSRVATVESKFTVTDIRLNRLERKKLSNCVTVLGLAKNSFKTDTDTRSFVMAMFGVLNISEHNPIFDFRWDQSSSLLIFILDKDVVTDMYDKYHSISDGKDGFFSEDFASLNYVTASNIRFEFSDECNCQKNIDSLETINLHNDIKIDGIQYLVNETPSTLQKHFIEISTFLKTPVSANDFRIRRIQKSSICIATFQNAVIREKVFYAYIQLVKDTRSSGISKNSISNVPCARAVFFNDHLGPGSRVIYNFCRRFVKEKQIFGISTRRGKIVIKIKSEDEWTLVNSLDDLHKLIRSHS